VSERAICWKCMQAPQLWHGCEKKTSRTSFLHATHPYKEEKRKIIVRHLCSQHGRTRPVFKMKTTHGQVTKEHCANVTNFH